MNVDVSNQPTGTPLWAIAGGIDYTQRGVWGGSVNYSLQDACIPTLQAYAYPTVPLCWAATASVIRRSRGHLSRQRTDARIAWDADGHKWGVALYANNLLNKRYVDGIDTTSAQSLGVLGATIYRAAYRWV